MQAIQIREYTPDPSTLVPVKTPKPQPDTSNCLRIRVTHCSPQHADILHAQGTHQNNNKKRGWCHPPFNLGYDFSGYVDDILPDTLPANSDLKKGDRVFGSGIGAFAEYVVVSPRAVRKVPRGVSSEAACAMAGQAVSFAAVTHVAKVQKGETVLVSGASGGLGSACCMVAKAVGARVIALTEEETKAEMMRRDMGLDVVVMDEEERWVDEVKGLTTDKDGVHVVFDDTGMVNSAIGCLRYGGRIIVLGFAARKGEMEAVKMNRLLLKSATITGYRFGESSRQDPRKAEWIWKTYLEMLENGELKPNLYGSYKGLGDIGRALGDLKARKVYGKIVVKISDDEEKPKL